MQRVGSRFRSQPPLKKKNFSRRRFGSLVFSHNSVLPLLRAPLAALSHYSLSSALLAAKLHKEETKYTRLDITFEAPSSFLRHGPFSQTADLKLPTEERARKRREKRDNRTTSRGERERERERERTESKVADSGAERSSLRSGSVDPSIRPSVCLFRLSFAAAVERSACRGRRADPKRRACAVSQFGGR